MKKSIQNIAVIGTGNMGAPMARNLAKAGFHVKAHDIVGEKILPILLNLTPHLVDEMLVQ